MYYEPVVPEPSSFKVEIIIQKMKRYKLTEQNQAGGKTLHLKSHKCTNFIWNISGIRKNIHSNGRNLLLYLLIKREMKLTVVIIEEYQCYQLHTKFYQIFFSQI